jgi:hypothetical protein
MRRRAFIRPRPGTLFDGSAEIAYEQGVLHGLRLALRQDPISRGPREFAERDEEYEAWLLGVSDKNDGIRAAIKRRKEGR